VDLVVKNIFIKFIGIFACCFLLIGCGKEIDPKNISKEEFDKLSIGMSQLEVNKIVGGIGEKISESKDGTVTTYVYKIDGEQSGSAELTFQIDADLKLAFHKVVLTSKTQKDLK